jgi:hypothetical protein
MRRVMMMRRRRKRRKRRKNLAMKKMIRIVLNRKMNM